MRRIESSDPKDKFFAFGEARSASVTPNVAMNTPVTMSRPNVAVDV